MLHLIMSGKASERGSGMASGQRSWEGLYTHRAGGETGGHREPQDVTVENNGIMASNLVQQFIPDEREQRHYHDPQHCSRITPHAREALPVDHSSDGTAMGRAGQLDLLTREGDPASQAYTSPL